MSKQEKNQRRANKLKSDKDNEEKQYSLTRELFDQVSIYMFYWLDSLLADGNPNHYPGGVDLNYISNVSEDEMREMIEEDPDKEFIPGFHYPTKSQIRYAKARKILQKIMKTEITKS